MGFFVCGFVRRSDQGNGHKPRPWKCDEGNAQQTRKSETTQDDEWAGFSD